MVDGMTRNNLLTRELAVKEHISKGETTKALDVSAESRNIESKMKVTDVAGVLRRAE